MRRHTIGESRLDGPIRKKADDAAVHPVPPALDESLSGVCATQVRCPRVTLRRTCYYLVRTYSYKRTIVKSQRLLSCTGKGIGPAPRRTLTLFAT